MIKEKLAAYVHGAWSGWMEYLFEKSTFEPDGTVTIPKWAVDRWKKQARTPYEELSEEEKANDRKEAYDILKIINRIPSKFSPAE